MKQFNIITSLLITLLLLYSCSEDTNIKEKESSTKEQLEEEPINSDSASIIKLEFGASAELIDEIINKEETTFMHNENKKIAQVFSPYSFPLVFFKANESYAAFAERDSVFFGEKFYKFISNWGNIITESYENQKPNTLLDFIGKSRKLDLKKYYDIAKKWDNEKAHLVLSSILAHEVSHLIQRKNNLPTKNKRYIQRDFELEADGFAGYYMRKRDNGNLTWKQISISMVLFGFISTTDNPENTESHGTENQRRAAFRLGYLLGEENLTPKEFDTKFFEVYDNVLNGHYSNTSKHFSKKANTTEFKSNIPPHILNKMNELYKIYTGQVGDKEYQNLK